MFHKTLKNQVSALLIFLSCVAYGGPKKKPTNTSAQKAAPLKKEASSQNAPSSRTRTRQLTESPAKVEIQQVEAPQNQLNEPLQQAQNVLFQQLRDSLAAGNKIPELEADYNLLLHLFTHYSDANYFSLYGQKRDYSNQCLVISDEFYQLFDQKLPGWKKAVVDLKMPLVVTNASLNLLKDQELLPQIVASVLAFDHHGPSEFLEVKKPKDPVFKPELLNTKKNEFYNEPMLKKDTTDLDWISPIIKENNIALFIEANHHHEGGPSASPLLFDLLNSGKLVGAYIPASYLEKKLKLDSLRNLVLSVPPFHNAGAVNWVVSLLNTKAPNLQSLHLTSHLDHCVLGAAIMEVENTETLNLNNLKNFSCGNSVILSANQKSMLKGVCKASPKTVKNLQLPPAQTVSAETLSVIANHFDNLSSLSLNAEITAGESLKDLLKHLNKHKELESLTLNLALSSEPAALPNNSDEKKADDVILPAVKTLELNIFDLEKDDNVTRLLNSTIDILPLLDMHKSENKENKSQKQISIYYRGEEQSNIVKKNFVSLLFGLVQKTGSHVQVKYYNRPCQ